MSLYQVKGTPEAQVELLSESPCGQTKKIRTLINNEILLVTKEVFEAVYEPVKKSTNLIDDCVTSDPNLKDRFEVESKTIENPQILVTLVKLPTGAIEMITNTKELKSKIEYLLNAYDNDFKLKNNPNVSIVGFLLY